MLGAIAGGPSVLRQPLRGEDPQSTRRALEAMGLMTREDSGDVVALEPSPWRTPAGPLDCGNSGTTMRLLAGLVAGHPIEATLVGDASLSRRPMERIVTPLRAMGARVEGDRAPIVVRGGRLQGITHESRVASAQVKSCLLLAGLFAEGTTVVLEPEQSRDHTERLLASLGVRLTVVPGPPWRYEIEGGQAVHSFDFLIPGDISSAAFFMVAAAMLPGAQVACREVGTNPTRTGLLDVLTQAGVTWWAENETGACGEPIADLVVSASDNLRAFTIEGPLVPRLIDEVPILAVLATQCVGETVIRDAAELRMKESDRLQAMANGLRAMGARIEATADGLVIEGPTPLAGTGIEAHGDHRIAMAFAIAGLVASGETVIEGSETIATSFPSFAAELERLCVV